MDRISIKLFLKMGKTEPWHSTYVEGKLSAPFLNKECLLFSGYLLPTFFFFFS